MPNPIQILIESLWNHGFKYLSVSFEGSLGLILSTLGLPTFSFVGQS